MKKVLFSLLATLAVSVLSAQTTSNTLWTASLTPVSEASQLGQTHVTVAADSSVIVTGTYNQAFSFGSKSVANDDAMTSAYIAKYDKQGSALWIATLYGSAYVRDLTTDTKGNVYAVGAFADEVTCTGADGKATTITGMPDEQALASGFIARLTADGAFSAIRTVYPTVNASISGSELYYPESGDMNFLPQQVRVSGGKVYVVAQYTGNVSLDNVSWPGSYLNVFDFMYSDLSSFGIMALSADDLTEATSVAYLQAKGDGDANLTSMQENPQSCRIAVDGSSVYAAFTGKGNEVLVTPNGKKDLALASEEADDGTIYSCPVIMAKVTDGTVDYSKVFSTKPNDKAAEYGTDKVSALTLEDGKLYVGGTFYGELGFNTSVTATGAADMYVAAVNAADFSTLWAATDAFNEGATNNYDELVTGMAVVKGQATLVGYSETKSDRTIVKPLQLTASSASDAKVTELTDSIVSLCDLGNGIRASIANKLTTTTVTVTSSAVNTGISSIAAPTAVADNKAYTLDGRFVGNATALPKGLYIIGKKKVVVR